MLLRPPFIQQEDVRSQTSNPISQMEKQKSVKSTSKNKKKQNTLGMKKNNIIGTSYNNSTLNNNTQTQNHYDSDNGSVHSVNSRKSKGRAKQSTIAIGKPLNMNQNSAYSIKNKNQKQQYEIFKLDSDDDNKSVGSHASKNSRKNTVKENSLGGKNKNPKVSVQLNYYYNQKEQDPSPRNYYMQEESKVQIVKLNENVDTFTQPLKYNETLKGAPLTKNPQSRRRTQQVVHKPLSSSPFEEITLKRQQEYDEPVYRLEEPQQNMKRKYQTTGNNLFGGNNTNNNRINKQQQNPFSQRANNNNNTNNFTQNNNNAPTINYQMQHNKITKLEMQQSVTIQPQMISTKSVTKSRRNKIFDNDNNSISNSSNVMNSRSNMQGSFEKSRSKSKSKLGELLKQSRDKKQELANTKERQNGFKPAQLGYGNNQSKNQQQYQPQPQPQQQYKQQGRYQNQKYGYDNYNNINPSQQKISQVTNKNLKPSQQNNSYSNNPKIENNFKPGGQRLADNHLKPQPIQRKSIQNQVFDLGQSQLQLNLSMSHKVPQSSGAIKGDSVLFNFQPQRKKGISITSKDKPSSTQNKSLQSKKHLDRLMKKCQQNQQFLAKSILSNNSQLRQSKKPAINNTINSFSPNVMKKQQTLTRPFERLKEKSVQVQQEPAWHQMVKNDAAFQIKSVERRQVRRPSQQVIKITPPEQNQTKPMSPAEFFRLQNQQYQQKKSQQNIKPQPYQDMKYQQQIQNQRRIQQQEKNRILAQMNKKSKPQTQQQIMYNISPPSSNNNNIKSEPFYKQLSEQEINLNYSDPLDIKERKVKNDLKPNQYIKDQVQSSSISHQLSLSQNGSQRSNSQSTKKQRKKQSSLNIMKKHKVQVRQQQPRAQQSFYEEPPQQIPMQFKEQVKVTKVQSQDNTDRTFKFQASKTKVDYKKPNLINFQQNEIQEEKIKSKTDMNFYNYGEGSQRSIRPPSSKPPLSRKSNCSSSKSKSKAKESTLNINPVKKQTKIKQISNQNNNKYQQQQQPKKKKTLLEIAQDKQYQGSGYGGSDSQCSFNSRESFGSVNSKGSRRSSSSKKQSTLPITIKNKSTTMNQFRPSLNKLTSTASQVEIFSNDSQSIYNSLQQQSVRKSSRERDRSQQYQQQYQQQQRQERTIVSKDTYFIDERGRLVKQDLVIKGNQIYSQPASNKSAQQMAMQRMKRSRQHHRSRSKSRDGSRSRLSKKASQSSMEESGYQSASSSNYFNNNNNNKVGSNLNYDSQYGGMNNQQKRQPQGNLYIQQFIKPVQQPSHQRVRQQQQYKQQQGYNFQKPSSSSNQRRIQQQFYQSQQQPQQQQYYKSYYQNDQYEQQYQQEPQVQHVTLNQLFGRNQKNNNNNSSSNYYTTNSKQSTNQNYYKELMGQSNNCNSNNFNNTSNSRRQQNYGNATNSRFNGQQSGLRQSSRKKSLSRTQKTFYNR